MNEIASHKIFKKFESLEKNIHSKLTIPYDETECNKISYHIIVDMRHRRDSDAEKLCKFMSKVYLN